MDNEVMTYDVIIVGAGPSGLAAAIRLKQLSIENNHPLSVCVLEKGSQVGAHILSGAVIEPHSLRNLLKEDWQQAPLNTPVTKDRFYLLTKKHAIRLPTPRPMKNPGNFIIRLGELCQFLGKYAESLGCEIYPGFAATKILYNEDNAVMGVATSDQGINKQGERTEAFQPGMHLHAKQTLFAEGCRGQLSQSLMQHYQLRQGFCPQTYGIGIKEIWQIPAQQHQLGHVIHTFGWPLDSRTYGGSFVYFLKENLVALGLVIGLDYKNPWLNAFQEFQRFKTHPFIHRILHQGERIAYGARALNEGGYQSIPRLCFPGGVLIGDAAGFLNVPKIKGTHTAIESGVIAAEATFKALKEDKPVGFENKLYDDSMRSSWVVKELYQVRNIRPAFQHGLWIGLLNAAFETYLTFGKSPWTFKHPEDHEKLVKARDAKKINYPKPDGILTFDKLSSVYLTNTFHEENEPAHLVLRDPNLAIEINYHQYASPETRYCPAQVYEIINEDTNPRLQINAQNCIHCKTCDIKDPHQNIIWTAPIHGGGPNYVGM